MEIDASGSVVAGQHIYAIGSPYGLDNSISEGIISNPCRAMGGIDYLQFTAPISSGSSGGAIIDDQGHAIGISTMAFVSTETSTTQNLNLAVPISLLSTLQCKEYSDFPAQAATDQTGTLFIENQYSQYIGVGTDDAYIPVFFESDGLVVVEYRLDNPENGVATVSWGEFEDGWIPLNIIGNKVGAETLTINLYADDGVALLDSERVEIFVVDAVVTSSNCQPIVYANWFTRVEIFQNNPVPDTRIFYEIEDPSIVSCTWNDWIDDNRIILTINGVKPGRTTVCVWIEDSLGNYLRSCSIAVTVYDSSSIYIIPSSDTISLTLNNSASVNIFESMGTNLYQLIFYTENDNISCEWGPWSDDYNTSLKITGIAHGTSQLYVFLFAEADTVAYAVTINVTVR